MYGIPSQETAGGIFVSQLSGRVHAIFELAHLIGICGAVVSSSQLDSALLLDSALQTASSRGNKHRFHP